MLDILLCQNLFVLFFPIKYIWNFDFRSISPCSNSSSSTSSTSLDWVEIGLRLPNGRRIDARFPPERTPFQVRTKITDLYGVTKCISKFGILRWDFKAVFVISQSEVKCLAKKGSQYPRDEFAKAADQAEERVCLIWSRIVRSDQENLINFQSRNFL